MSRVAVVRSAEVVVVAVQCKWPLATPLLALVAYGARVTVVAIEVCGGMQTGAVETRVGGAEIPVVADYVCARLTLGQLADVAGSAEVAIAAGSGIGNEGAAAAGETDVGGAGVAVVTLHRQIRGTNAVTAVVIAGALIAVIARCVNGHESAATVGLADVLSAGVVVLAGQQGTGGAEAGIAFVPNGTEVTVITRGAVRLMGTARHGGTEVVGTWIIVAAVNQASADATSAGADVGDGAGIEVITLG